MTDEERREAERLAKVLRHFTPLEHRSFVDGYVKGRESMRVELVAERERSANLVEAIKDYIECDELLSADGKPSFSAQEFISAIAEYEANSENKL